MGRGAGSQDAFESLEVDGCKPAQKATRSIDLIEYRMDEFQATQEEFSIEQKAQRRENAENFKEILKRLPAQEPE